MKRAKKRYSGKVILTPEEDGGYTLLVPLLPGCVSYGRTLEEAIRNGKEAIELHLANLVAHAQPIPEGNESI
jgi:predicted RNase H-like HicB family nuclease